MFGLGYLFQFFLSGGSFICSFVELGILGINSLFNLSFLSFFFKFFCLNSIFFSCQEFVMISFLISHYFDQLIREFSLIPTKFVIPIKRMFGYELPVLFLRQRVYLLLVLILLVKSKLCCKDHKTSHFDIFEHGFERLIFPPLIVYH